MIPNAANQRGKDFEDMVAGCLGLLQSRHPKTVEVKHHPRLDLQNGTFVIPDFELTCTFPHQTDRRLIECQSRNKSSQDIANRIRTIKSLSPRNRFILVFKDADYLSAAVKQALDADGVVCYPLFELAAFLSKLSDALTAQAATKKAAAKEPREIKKLPQPPQREMRRLIGQELGAAASKEFMEVYSSFSQKSDQSMLPPRRGW